MAETVGADRLLAFSSRNNNEKRLMVYKTGLLLLLLSYPTLMNQIFDRLLAEPIYLTHNHDDDCDDNTRRPNQPTNTHNRMGPSG